MDFAFSDEQEMLRASARKWLADRYPLDRVAALADSADGWRLTGLKRAVPDGSAAAEAVVVARTGDGVALFRVDLGAAPDAISPLSTMDSTRRLAELRLDGTPAELLSDASAAPAVLQAT